MALSVRGPRSRGVHARMVPRDEVPNYALCQGFGTYRVAKLVEICAIRAVKTPTIETDFSGNTQRVLVLSPPRVRTRVSLPHAGRSGRPRQGRQGCASGRPKARRTGQSGIGTNWPFGGFWSPLGSPGELQEAGRGKDDKDCLDGRPRCGKCARGAQCRTLRPA